MSGAPATVLVVDDSPENRYAIRRYLSGGEFDVWEAETGAEGLEMAARDPDLIVLDVHLPDINGFEVCRRLKEDERTRHIPVLQRSQSHVDDAARVHGLESGADAYLTEPVDPSVLVATARALLRVRRAENRLRLLNQVGVQLATALTRGDVLQSVSAARERRDRPRPDVLPVRREPPPAARDARRGRRGRAGVRRRRPRGRGRAHGRAAVRRAPGHRAARRLRAPAGRADRARGRCRRPSASSCWRSPTQCAQALERAGLYEYQHHIATTLQEGLLPKSLPEIAGAELAARYNAGARAMEVGGDFYDVFPRGEDWVMVIGDVCGRGAEAAALTGLARHTIRAQAQHLERPSEILRALHDAIVAEVGRDSARFVTAGCVLLAPRRRRARLVRRPPAGPDRARRGRGRRAPDHRPAARPARATCGSPTWRPSSRPATRSCSTPTA